jgi:hypothetical protein
VWVGNGRSGEFYRDTNEEAEPAAPRPANHDRARTRRTAGWQIELD